MAANDGQAAAAVPAVAQAGQAAAPVAAQAGQAAAPVAAQAGQAAAPAGDAMQHVVFNIDDVDMSGDEDAA